MYFSNLSNNIDTTNGSFFFNVIQTLLSQLLFHVSIYTNTALHFGTILMSLHRQKQSNTLFLFTKFWHLSHTLTLAFYYK